MPDGVARAQAMPLAVAIPTTLTASDSFIEDLIWVFLDTPLSREQKPHAAPLEIHLTSRPRMGTAEPVNCQGTASAPKLEAEGAPAEKPDRWGGFSTAALT